MENRSQPAGILSIVSGAIAIAIGILVVLLIIFMGKLMSSADFNEPMPDGFFNIMLAIYSVVGFIYALIGVLAITGGVFSLRKKNWGLNLAGAIAAAAMFFPCGIIAVIFVCLGKAEFDKSQEAVITPAPVPPVTSTIAG